jgi:hypothetical protein
MVLAVRNSQPFRDALGARSPCKYGSLRASGCCPVDAVVLMVVAMLTCPVELAADLAGDVDCRA